MEREKKEVFADGTGKLYFLGEMFRIEFKSMSLSDEKDTSGFRIIMPPQGFLRMFQSMTRVVEKFKEHAAPLNRKKEKVPEKTKKTSGKSSGKTVDKQHKQTKNKPKTNKKLS